MRQVLEPHGFRPGRGCHTAIAEAKRHVEDGYEWCVDLDLEKFFDLVCHQRLVAKLAERVSDRRLLVLIGRMLKAKVVLPDGLTEITCSKSQTCDLQGVSHNVGYRAEIWNAVLADHSHGRRDFWRDRSTKLARCCDVRPDRQFREVQGRCGSVAPERVTVHDAV